MQPKKFCAITLLSILLYCATTFAKPILAIQKWQTKNNVHVYFVKSTILPMLDIRLIFNAGSAYDNQLPGLASLTNSMLSEGAANLNADQIAEIFDKNGAQFSTSTEQDMSIVSIRSLTSQPSLHSSIDLLNKIITNPTFPHQELQRLKHQTLTAISAQKQIPRIIADKNFFANLYGNYPYAHSVIGKSTSVKKIKRQDIINFYRKYYAADNAILIIVGDISNNQAHKLANKITTRLPKGKTILPIPNPKPLTNNLTKFIKYPGSQTYIRLGYLGITHNSANYFPMIVGNYVLGQGLLVSRLFKAVRQKYGLSYSVNSKLIMLKQAGPFIISLQTKNKSCDQAVKISNQVLQQFIQQGPTKKELNAAKKHLTGSFALKLDSNTKIINTISILAFYNLPTNYLDTYKQKINSVTIQQVKSSFQNLLQKQKMLTVIVGQSTK